MFGGNKGTVEPGRAATCPNARDDGGVEELRLAADDFVLGRIDSSRLPMAAAWALARGAGQPVAAGAGRPGQLQPRESADLFSSAMAELGHPLRPSTVVRWDRARRAAQALLAGERAAPDVAGEIAALLVRDGPIDLASRFEMVAVLWDDLPSHHAKLVSDAETAAKTLLAWESAPST